MFEKPKQFFKKIYKKKPIFLTLNVTGIIFSIIGALVCITLVVGIFFVNNEVRTQTNTFEKAFNEQLDVTNSALNSLYERVEDFQTIEDIQIEVDNLVDTNVEKLKTIRSGIIVINYGGRLDNAVEKIDEVISFMKSIKKIPATLVEVKSAVKEKIQLALDKVASIENRVHSTVSTIKNVSKYSVFATILLAVIFMTGEIVLFGRCRSNLSKRKELMSA